MKKKQILEEDIIDIDKYIRQRKEIKSKISEMKKSRRIQIGPHATFYFECYETMHYQIQEMLFIERGGRDQMIDELKAYNPLIPNGNELVATLMFEIADEEKRKIFLHTIGNIEKHIYLQIDNGEKIYAKPEDDTERTNEEGKASSVHFLHFPLNENYIKEFKKNTNKVLIGFDHQNYQHMTFLNDEQKESLIEDFD